jgi:hypothetical protein
VKIYNVTWLLLAGLAVVGFFFYQGYSGGSTSGGLATPGSESYNDILNNIDSSAAILGIGTAGGDTGNG